jgi:steroid delta-isomerase-like uncharacterized protein
MSIPALADAWNARDAAAVAALFTEDGVRHQFAVPEGRFEGRDAVTEAAGTIMHAVPDCRLEIVSATEAADVAVVEWLFSGTLQNDIPGLPANGGAVRLPGVSVCRMQGDRIREERVYWDTATLMAAAGLLA